MYSLKIYIQICHFLVNHAQSRNCYSSRDTQLVHEWHGACVFQPRPLHTDTPPDSLKFLIPPCIAWWNLQSLPFYIQLFSEIVLQFLVAAGCRFGKPLSIFTPNRLCVSEMFLLYSVMLLTCCQLTSLIVKCFCFYFCTNYLSSLLLPLIFLFSDVLLPSKWANIFHEMLKCLSFNTWYVLYAVLEIKYGFMIFANNWIPFLIHILHSVPIFWKLGLQVENQL